MNATRRVAIQEQEEKLTEAREALELIRDEEQEYLDNMPENLQTSDKYDQAEEAITELDSVVDGIEDLVNSLNTAKGE